METILVKYAEEMDSPYLKRLSKWTHDRDGFINRFKPGVAETIAPPPEGDNDLAE